MMNFKQTVERIQTVVDELLVSLAEAPESRYMIQLPPLQEGQDAPHMDCLEYKYCIAQLREVVTYKYLLHAFRTKQLAASRECLAMCLSCLRATPAVDYYDLGDYHEMAYACYKGEGDEQKASRHLLDCYMDRGRAIISSDKVYDCKELIMALLKDRGRMEAFIWYVIDFIVHDFEDLQDYMARSQYLLLERVLVLAVKLFAENAACPKDLRCGVYHAQAGYYDLTGRKDEAKAARQACLNLGGKKNYKLTLTKFLLNQPSPRLSDMRFLDYVLYIMALEEDEVYRMDRQGNVDLDAEDEFFILEKDGRVNFMDTYYRQMPGAMAFRKVYDEACGGHADAVREVARRYQTGDGVTECRPAAAAWEKKLG